MAEPSAVTVFADSVAVDHVSAATRYGILLGRVDVTLDQVNSQPHHHAQDVHFLAVHGGYLAVARLDQRSGEARPRIFPVSGF